MYTHISEGSLQVPTGTTDENKNINLYFNQWKASMIRTACVHPLYNILLLRVQAVIGTVCVLTLGSSGPKFEQRTVDIVLVIGELFSLADDALGLGNVVSRHIVVKSRCGAV